MCAETGVQSFTYGGFFSPPLTTQSLGPRRGNANESLREIANLTETGEIDARMSLSMFRGKKACGLRFIGLTEVDEAVGVVPDRKMKGEPDRGLEQRNEAITLVRREC